MSVEMSVTVYLVVATGLILAVYFEAGRREARRRENDDYLGFAVLASIWPIVLVTALLFAPLWLAYKLGKRFS